MSDDESPYKRFKQDNGAPNYGTSGSAVASKLMAKMGYQEGKGLGVKEQGITQPISLGGGDTKHGLGHDARKLIVNDPNAVWDPSVEEKNVEESPTFIAAPEEVRDRFKQEFDNRWIVEGPPQDTLHGCDGFCDSDLVEEVIEAKAVFDHLDKRVLNEARKRANPYETVMGGIFQNRAAMKTANLDKVFGWKLSYELDEEKRLAKNPVERDVEPSNVTRDDEMFYFADVCAGPGGFSEYMIWRKAFYNVKGFGFTLRGNDDFKLQNFRAGSASFFETYYGVEANGDVTNPRNLTSLEEYVKKRTNNKGCHLVMCDGGFSVNGKEEIQEILSKRLYLCQFIVGLSLGRVQSDLEKGGNFVCKLFDVFTSFSAGLIYLMYCAYERISLHKPNTSRPANSERYIFCENLTEFGASIIKNYLIHINDCLDKMDKNNSTILEVVPYDFICDDVNFFNYFKANNEEFAKKQIIYLNKYKEFSKNKGAFDTEQANLRENCLKYWEIPDKPRNKDFSAEPAQLALRSMFGKHTFAYNQFAPFTLSEPIWKQDAKQIRLRELCSVLLPEFTAPTLLVSNERGDAYIYRDENNAEKLDDLRLPPKTLLLVQETSLYKQIADNKIEPYTGRSKVIFVVDACSLSADDVSVLPYEKRLEAIQKFCKAVNRGIESISMDLPPQPQYNQQHNNKRRYNDHQQQPEFRTPARPPISYYLHGAEIVQMQDLEQKFEELQPVFYKQKSMALRKFDFPDGMSTQEDLRLPCQAVRVVQRYKAGYVLCWSNSNNRPFIFDCNTGKAGMQIQKEVNASFFDHLVVSYQNRQSGQKDLSWIWSWKADPKSGYDLHTILKSEAFADQLTVRSLCDAIEERLRGYTVGAMSEELM